MHSEAYSAVIQMLQQIPTPSAVYEVGSCDYSKDGIASFRKQLPNRLYHGIDLCEGPGVDEVADAITYVPPFVPDLIICTEVLEHQPNVIGLLSQLYNVLGNDGHLILTCAGIYRLPHTAYGGKELPREGEYYGNISELALAFSLLNAGFKEENIKIWMPTTENHSGVNKTAPELIKRIMIPGQDLYALARK